MSDKSESIEVPREEMLEDEEMPTFTSISSKDSSLPYNGEIPPDNEENISNHVQVNNGIDTEEQTKWVTNEQSVENAEHEYNDDDKEEEKPIAERSELDGQSCETEIDKDQDKDSVYVVSSDDDDDQRTKESYDDESRSKRSYTTDGRSKRSYDEDDDERRSDGTYDSDLDDMEEEEEDDEDEEIHSDLLPMPFPFVTDMEADDDESDGADDLADIEDERDDVMSDDVSVRLRKPTIVDQKVKSRSLQDLSVRTIASKQRSANVRRDKYHHVESKVRRYIQNAKEASRRSVERRNQLVAMEAFQKRVRRNVEIALGEYRDEEYNDDAMPRPFREHVRQYLAKRRKEAESAEGPWNAAYIPLDATENSPRYEELNHVDEEDEERKIDRYHAWPKDFLGDVPSDSNVARIEIVDCQRLDLDPSKVSKLSTGDGRAGTPNGQLPVQNILDVRSIGYDEYMRGSSVDKRISGNNSRPNSTNKDKNVITLEVCDPLAPQIQVIEEETEVVEEEAEVVEEEAEVVEEEAMVVESETDSKAGLRREANVPARQKSEESGKNQQSISVELLQARLNQKSTQCREIRDAYQKTLTENFDLKRELEDLKKTLSKFQREVKTPAIVVDAAVQVERPEQRSEGTDTGEELNPGSSLKSSDGTLESTMSATEQWTDTNCSLPTSNGSTRPPPNLTPLLNSDESGVDGRGSTPIKSRRHSSQAYQTSSKIIKMLTSMTGRRSKGRKDQSSVTTTPVSQRTSNKRKASEMPESDIFQQPTKIPHTMSNGTTRITRTTGKSESLRVDAEECLENEDADDDDDEDEETREAELEDKVKCYTFPGAENINERSFLIQAADGKLANDADDQLRGTVRECGPYLLGNVEVRMSEVNGTINIWGKEVSQEKNPEELSEEQETNLEGELMRNRISGNWQDTPDGRFANGPVSCSTNKRLSVPPLKLGESFFSKNARSPLTSCPKDPICSGENGPRERRYTRHSCNLEPEIDCRHSCGCNKSSGLSNFVGLEAEIAQLLSKMQCACRCAAYAKPLKHCCGAGHDDVPINRRRSCGHEVENDEVFHVSSPRLCSTIDRRSPLYRHTLTRSQSYPDKVEDPDADVFKRPSTSSRPSNYLRVGDPCCDNDTCARSQSTSNVNEQQPLLGEFRHETPEVRRRRLSGKRVRGILMNFIRGCGDCQANVSSSQAAPQSRVTSGSPTPVASTSVPQRGSGSCATGSKRCAPTDSCSSCNRRSDMAAEIEAQLEVLRVEMERLRSRSDAVMGLLNTLYSSEMN